MNSNIVCGRHSYEQYYSLQIDVRSEAAASQAIVKCDWSEIWDPESNAAFPSVYCATRAGIAQSIQILDRGWLVRRLNPGGGQIFCTHPDRPWWAHSHLYNGYRDFTGMKRAGRGVEHPFQSSAEVKERVELYIYSRYGPSCPVLGWTLTLLCDTNKKTVISNANWPSRERSSSLTQATAQTTNTTIHILHNIKIHASVRERETSSA
jgi:hypothetical protein